MGAKETKIFFATDVHGSELCFKKFIAAAKFYGNVNILILGGDMTGKMVVPFVEVNGTFKINYLGSLVTCETKSEFDDFFSRIASVGYYPYKTTPSEMEEILADQNKTDSLFRRLMRETVDRWVAYAEQKLDPSVKCYFMPGNDDPPEIYENWNSRKGSSIRQPSWNA